MITVCDKNKCAGCMACADVCPHGAIQVDLGIQAYNAVVDSNKCVNCDLCRKVCQINSIVELKAPLAMYQGWIKDDALRAKSTSGGAARALAEEFISRGGAVCSCVFKGGEFVFEFAYTKDESGKFAGSKYVKSNPRGIYGQIKNALLKGEKILFIGLPCQVAGLKLFVGDKYDDALFTVDLLCHGTPSLRLLQEFSEENKIALDKVTDISFRQNTKYRLAYDGVPVAPKGAVDNYHLAFLCGLDLTDNCYECRYACGDRVSDITLGDAWDSGLDTKQRSKGISLILCQSEKGKQLLEASHMELFSVDIEKLKSSNGALNHPVEKSGLHRRFFDKYEKNGFNAAVFGTLTAKCIKQKIKALLSKLGTGKSK